MIDPISGHDLEIRTVTCRTEECENNGIGIQLMIDITEPFVVCGPCGQTITDIVDPS